MLGQLFWNVKFVNVWMGYRHEWSTNNQSEKYQLVYSERIMYLFELRSCSFILALIPTIILALLDSWYICNLSNIFLHVVQSAKLYSFFVLCISYLCIENIDIFPPNIYENGPLVLFLLFSVCGLLFDGWIFLAKCRHQVPCCER